MTRPSGMPNSQHRQHGASLVVALIFLAVLTLVGYSAMNTSILEGSMASHRQDRERALQAAEMALRDAQTYLINNISGLSGFSKTCVNGLCYNGPLGYGTNPPSGMANPVWASSGLMDDNAKTITYGEITGATAISGVAAQPRYLIEGFLKWPPGEPVPIPYYRIVVRAQGARTSTVVWLQEIFRL